jgi:RNA polymerase sigma factor (sigma-70 family)
MPHAVATANTNPGRTHGATQDEIEAVYRERSAQMTRVALAITDDPDAARDAVHDAFADALRTRDTFRGDSAVQAWLWQAVINRARNQRRWSRLRRVRQEPLSDHEAATSIVGDPGVRQLVSRLPERQRLVLFLRYYADLDYDAIATALGIRPGTVGATLNQAHTALRSQLEEDRT